VGRGKQKIIAWKQRQMKNKIESEIYLNLDNFELPYSTRKAIVEKLGSYVKHREKEAQKELLEKLDIDFETKFRGEPFYKELVSLLKKFK